VGLRPAVHFFFTNGSELIIPCERANFLEPNHNYGRQKFLPKKMLVLSQKNIFLLKNFFVLEKYFRILNIISQIRYNTKNSHISFANNIKVSSLKLVHVRKAHYISVSFGL